VSMPFARTYLPAMTTMGRRRRRRGGGKIAQ
jgi:hypothetical protein